MAPPGAVVVSPSRAIRGSLRVPGDKSISHRYAILAALAAGRVGDPGVRAGSGLPLHALVPGGLGRQISRSARPSSLLSDEVAGGFCSPDGAARRRQLGHDHAAARGRSRRPPLLDHADRRRLAAAPADAPRHRAAQRMGARIESDGGAAAADRPRRPARRRSTTRPRCRAPRSRARSCWPVSSATGTTRVTEAPPTRNHTELALRRFGADIRVGGAAIEVTGGRQLAATDVDVPGDFSSAAFWCVAAAACRAPRSRSRRSASIRAGPASWRSCARRRRRHGDRSRRRPPTSRPAASGCATGRFSRSSSSRTRCPALIDELPALAALATHGGEITVTGAAELRVKESDRISALVARPPRARRRRRRTARRLPRAGEPAR